MSAGGMFGKLNPNRYPFGAREDVSPSMPSQQLLCAHVGIGFTCNSGSSPKSSQYSGGIFTKSRVGALGDRVRKVQRALQH